MSNKPGYFDSERDTAIVDAGGFFCHACLEDKPVEDISPDPRYCWGCYDFLLKEVEILPRSKRPRWIPKEGKIGHQESIQVSEDMRIIMATLEADKTTVAIIMPSVGSRSRSKRGPKFKELPTDLIIQWASEGSGSKAIATKLRRQGVEVGFRTIARVLAGERVTT